MAASPPGNLTEPVASFGITNVTPSLAQPGGYTGTGLAQSPSEIAIGFNQPINVDLLPSGSSPIALYRVVDGVPTDSILDASPPISVSIEDGDTRIVVALDPTQPLTPGTYRLVIPAWTPIVSTDFTPLPGWENDVVLGDFAIAQPEAPVSRSQAIDLGTVLPNPSQVSGSLDLTTRPHDVALYRIQVPNNSEQPVWRLGLEVRSTDGSGFKTGLTLFDAQGRPVATSTVGRPSTPDNPYLFAEVQPGGTYYVGVSSFANLPGQPGGYEIASETGTAGRNAETQAGGGFVLNLVADPVDAPVKVLTFNLDHADPLDATPSGFTIGFNGVVETNSGTDPIAGGSTSSLKLVDSQGNVHNLTLASFDETNARLSYLFPTRLPAGAYAVIVPGSGGLTDLIGRPPVADGQQAGVLARFVVADAPPPSGPDLGVLYPGNDASASSTTVGLASGGSADVRFVAAMPGAIRISIAPPSPGLSMELAAPDGTVQSLDPSAASDGHWISLTLTAPGVYRLRLTSASPGPTTIGLTIQASRTDADSFIRNGIGQGSALDLRLISPQAPTPGLPANPGATLPVTPNPIVLTPTTPPFTSPSGPAPSSFATTEPGPTGQFPSSSGLGESLTATPPVNAIPVVDVGGQLVGRPDSRADRVAVVSNVGSTGSNVLAANQPLLPLGLILDPSRAHDARQPRQAEWTQPDESESATNGAIVVHHRGRKPGEAVEAEAAAPGTDWVDQALAAIGSLIAPDRAAESTSAVDEHLIASIDPGAAELGEAGETRVRQQIGLAEPVGLTLLIAALTQQGRRVLRRRAATDPDRKTSRPSPTPRPHHGRLSVGRASVSPCPRLATFEPDRFGR